MRVFGLLLAWPMVLGIAGCDCDSGLGPVDGGPIDGPDFQDCVGDDPNVTILCDVSQNDCCVNSAGQPLCVPTVECFLPFDCDAFETPRRENNCTYNAPLDPGQLAPHLDMASASDGTVMLSGYSPGRFPSARWGDLIVGVVSGTNVTWSIVDGVPDGTPVPQSGVNPIASGWRGGISLPGDNVGEFNAIAFSPTSGAVSISYYDRTNLDVKFATSADGGTTWSIHTVFSEGDSGRYTSLAYLVDGRPAISFLTMMPSEDPALRPTSVVNVAVAASTTPSSSADWVVFPITNPAVSTMACRASLCGDGMLCRADGACGVESTDVSVDCSFVNGDGATQPGCGTGTKCVSNADGVTFTCQATIGAGFVEDVPEANGLYTSLRATNTGLALVWHDRLRRTLRGSAFDAAADTWRPAFNIDGFDAVGQGDAGYNADLFIDAAGNWHIAYVDGAFEELRHAVIDATTLMNANPGTVRSVVDDGTRPPRERSIVGSDADIAVLASGEIRIVYQDSTQAEALVATRPAGETTWILQGGNAGTPLDSEDSTGFWTCQTLVGDVSHIATWWFNSSEFDNGTRIFTIP